MNGCARARAKLARHGSTVPTKELPVLRRVLMVTVVVVATLGALAAPVWGDDAGFGGISPSSGPPGTEISYTVTGPGSTSDADCRGSSAFRTELLAEDGTRIATGENTISADAAATPGPAFVRLICYIADETGRRVIRGVCTPFEITAPGSPAGPATSAPAGSTLDEPCPAAPRVVASQSVLEAQGRLSDAFNQVLTNLGG
jgi:hypothetical protein